MACLGPSLSASHASPPPPDSQGRIVDGDYQVRYCDIVMTVRGAAEAPVTATLITVAQAARAPSGYKPGYSRPAALGWAARSRHPRIVTIYCFQKRWLMLHMTQKLRIIISLFRFHLLSLGSAVWIIVDCNSSRIFGPGCRGPGRFASQKVVIFNS